jgi:hypothetical protein
MDLTQIQTDRRPTHPRSFSSRSIEKLLFFPHTKNRRTLNTGKSVTTLQAGLVQPAMILDRRSLNIVQGAMISLHKVFVREKCISSFWEKLSSFSSGIQAIDPSTCKG